jgi:hypothetical protein
MSSQVVKEPSARQMSSARRVVEDSPLLTVHSR